MPGRVSLVSSVLAPILLIGGWTVAAWLQPAGYSSTRQTISELAGHGATDRWLMTAALVGVGLCHLVTAYGLGAATPGRLVHALGGLATLAVAAFPLPAVGFVRCACAGRVGRVRVAGAVAGARLAPPEPGVGPAAGGRDHGSGRAPCAGGLVRGDAPGER